MNLAFVLIATAATAEPAAVAPRERTVVLLSLDGFPAALLDDRYLPAPTLRRLQREGASARRMTIANPAVTWPNHTTLVTGVEAARHGVLFNGLVVRGGEKAPVVYEQRERADLVRVPTVYDLADEAGLTAAQINWIPHQVDGTIRWAFHERPRADGPLEREMIAAGMLAADDLPPRGHGNSAWRDQLRIRAASYLLRRYRPNLLLLHLLNLDDTHHRYGHGTPAGHTAVALLDEQVRAVMETLETPPLLGKSTLIVVSDHGFKNVRRLIRPNILLREAGLLRADGPRLSGDVYAVCQGGTAMVYVDAGTGRSASAVADLFRGVEGIDRVVAAPDFAALGLPSRQENPQMGELWLVAKDGYAFHGPVDGPLLADVALGEDRGAHGYPAADPDMDALFLAWGLGIRPGATIDRMDNVDVAPTVAALLGLEMKNVRGRVLSPLLLPFPPASASARE